jgi:hypothetical protein
LNNYQIVEQSVPASFNFLQNDEIIFKMSQSGCYYGYVSTNERLNYSVNNLPFQNQIFICVSVFQNIFYSGNGGAIELVFQGSNSPISQIMLRYNTFYNTSAKYGGAIYFEVPLGAEIWQSCFVETTAEKGRAIYFTGGRENSKINFQMNHIHKAHTPFDIHGQRGDAAISGNLESSTRYNYDFQIVNFTASDESETEGAEFAVHISVQTSNYLTIHHSQFQHVIDSQLIYLLVPAGSRNVQDFKIHDSVFNGIDVKNKPLIYVDAERVLQFHNIFIAEEGVTLVHQSGASFPASSTDFSINLWTIFEYPSLCAYYLYVSSDSSPEVISSSEESSIPLPTETPTPSIKPTATPHRTVRPIYEESRDALSGGKVAGISAAVLAVVAGLVVAGYFIYKKTRRNVELTDDVEAEETTIPIQPQANNVTQENPLWDDNVVGEDDPFDDAMSHAI